MKSKENLIERHQEEIEKYVGKKFANYLFPYVVYEAKEDPKLTKVISGSKKYLSLLKRKFPQEFEGIDTRKLNYERMIYRAVRILDEESYVTANLRGGDWKDSRVRLNREDLLKEEEFKNLEKILDNMK